MAERRYIAVEGPPGVGKRALARRLSRRTQARLAHGPAGNPFLADYHQQGRRNALQVQLFFLLARYQQQVDLAQTDLFSGGALVLDYVFAREALYAALTLSPDELILYKKVYGLLAPRVPRPDLVVYLCATPEALLGRIRKRQVAHERSLTLDFIEEVAQAYQSFFFHWGESPLLVVDTSEIDLESDSREMEQLLAMIGKHKGGVQHYIPTLGSLR